MRPPALFQPPPASSLHFRSAATAPDGSNGYVRGTTGHDGIRSNRRVRCGSGVEAKARGIDAYR